MDPFSITAGVVGIAAPTLHCIRALLQDIRRLSDVPDIIKSLSQELASIESSLASLDGVSAQQWHSLGDDAAKHPHDMVALCKASCEKFHKSLARWTRHSEDGRLSFRDRATIGIFRQDQVQGMTDHLRQCNDTFTRVVTVATLQSTLGQATVTQETRALVSTSKTDVTGAMEAMEEQLRQVSARLDSLGLEDPDDGDIMEWKSAMGLLTAEKKNLTIADELNAQLLARVQDIEKEMQGRGQPGQVNISFGSGNQGVQVGQSYGNITQQNGPYSR